jgi:hypothetical protein
MTEEMFWCLVFMALVIAGIWVIGKMTRGRWL